MKYAFTLLLTLCALVVVAQSTQETLTNNSIIELKKAGLSVSVIKSKIAVTNCTFTLDTNSLIALKNANVDDDIIDAMVKKTPPMSTSAQPTNNPPLAPQEKWGKMDGSDTYVTSTGVTYTVGQKITLGISTGQNDSYKFIVRFNPFGYFPDYSEHLGGGTATQQVIIKKIIVTKEASPVVFLVFKFDALRRYGVQIEPALLAKEIVQ